MNLGTSMTTKEAINSNIGANVRYEMLLNVFIQFNNRKFIVRKVNHVKLTLILLAIVIQQSHLLLFFPPCDLTSLAFPAPDIPHSFYAQEQNEPVLN